MTTPSPTSVSSRSIINGTTATPSKMDRFKKRSRLVLAHIQREISSLDFFIACFFEAMAAFFFYYIVFSVHINATVNLYLSTESVALANLENNNPNSTLPTQALFNSAVFPTDINFLIEAVSTGITLTLIVLVLGPLSGAHVNPLVTFSFMLVGNFPIVKGIVYIITQMGASVVAAVLAPLSFYAAYGPPFISTADATGYPYALSNYTVVYPYPGATSPQVLLMEVMLAFFFIFFVFMISFDPETAVYIPSKSIRRRYSIVPPKGGRRVPSSLPEQRQGDADLEQGNAEPDVIEEEPEHEEEQQLQQKTDNDHASPSLEQAEAQSLTRRSVSPTSAPNLSEPHLEPPASFTNTMTHQSNGSVASSRARAARSPFSSPYYRLEKSIDINQQQSLQFIISISFGFLVTLILWVGSTVSGGAFNPARVFGPAIINNVWDYQWTYWVGGLLGSVIASGFYVFVYRKARVRAMKIASRKAKEIYEANL